MNFPILSAIIFIPLTGAIFVLLSRGNLKNTEKNAKYVAIFSTLVNFLMAIFLWYSFDPTTPNLQFIEKIKRSYNGSINIITYIVYNIGV